MGRYIFTLALPDATGASRMAFEFASAFRKKGHDVSLIHGNQPKKERSIVPEMQAIGVETVHEPGLSFPASPFLLGRLAKAFQSRQPNAIIAMQQRDRAIALQAAEKISVPSFIHLGNKHTFHGVWPWRKLKESYYRRVLSRCVRLIVCVSPVVQKELQEQFHIEPDRTELLINGVDVHKHVPVANDRCLALRRELGVNDDELMLINVGRIGAQKAQDVLVDAFSRFKPGDKKVKLVLVGGVTQDSRYAESLQIRSDLEKIIQDHQLADRVVFAGWRQDVPELLAASDAYVHSARWEGFPLSPLEAMSASKPCIWTDCSGHPEGFMNGVHGWVVPKENAAALSEAIQQVVDLTHEQRREMGAACRQLAEERYDIQKIGARFVELVETRSLN